MLKLLLLLEVACAWVHFNAVSICWIRRKRHKMIRTWSHSGACGGEFSAERRLQQYRLHKGAYGTERLPPQPQSSARGRTAA